jgi:hypothetical protein
MINPVPFFRTRIYGFDPLLLDRQIKTENNTTIGLTLNPDLATMFGNNSLTDGKVESHLAEGARSITVLSKNMLQVVQSFLGVTALRMI